MSVENTNELTLKYGNIGYLVVGMAEDKWYERILTMVFC